ncbi:MAG TPA: metalloregulator ArsR/SmtB family transcription factor [Chloroflexota bacterium]|nr:metalloregulator ArsR/SmtB family transcription factor [Chloroflexota bacterium]
MLPETLPDTEQAEALFELHARLCKVLTDPKRLHILAFLEHGRRSVNEIALKLGIRPSTVSQHLALMRQSGLLTTERQGTIIYYALAYPEILEACRIVRGILVKQLQAAGQLALSPAAASLRR